MNNEELLSTIIKYGLSVRQIPKTVISLFSMSNYSSSKHSIVEYELKEDWHYKYWKQKHPNSIDVRFDDERKVVYRKYAKEIKTPENAGYWMCKQINDTSSTVKWSIKDDNLAPTLLGSVLLFLDKTVSN